jgi:hypothetical protein
MDVPDEALFENLAEVWMKLGKQPTFKEARNPVSRYHPTTYQRRFGGWRKALEQFVAYMSSDKASSLRGTRT